jgi:fructokinase
MIVVAGEALIDLIPNASGELVVSVGGGPLNTARWLGRLGQLVGFLGALAGDLLGERIRDSLAETGVSLDLLIATDRSTTLALAQLDAAGAAQYSFYADRTSVADVTAAEAVAVLPSQFDALHVGGLGLMLEPVAEALEQVVDLAHRRGTLVMLDPNVRPSLLAERERYLARFYRVLAQTDVLKLSVEDLDWLAPGIEPLVAARQLAQRGPAAVLLTAGAAGATLLGAGIDTSIPAPAVELIDTIGAGDAFSAGFLHYWLKSGRDASDLANAEALIEATCFAVAVAGSACTVRGATPPRVLETPAF